MILLRHLLSILLLPFVVVVLIPRWLVEYKAAVPRWLPRLAPRTGGRA